MVDIILVFLGASLILYCILGGADFGAGILEIVSPRAYKNSVQQAVYNGMAPVWEANHMWLILAVVILFNGFPKLYSTVSIFLHIPLTMMLIGIILRGCAFTFRHYDAKQDNSKIYSLIFQYSSLLTTLMIGTIAGSLIVGKFHRLSSSSNYWDTYWAPWLNPFSLTVGCFLVVLFVYIASVFLIGETNDRLLKSYFSTCAKKSCGLAVIAGILVFGISIYQGVSFVEQFFGHTVSIICFLVATTILPLVFIALKTYSKWLLRVLVSVQMSAILIGWMGLQFPTLIPFEDRSSSLDFYNTAAPEATLKVLVGALILGSVFIFPAIAYLFKVFKSQQERT